MVTAPASVPNGGATPLAAIPSLGLETFRARVIGRVAAGARLSAFFAGPGPDAGRRLYAVLADGAAGALDLVSTPAAASYPSLTPDCPAAHWFERALFEDDGIRPEGHPWLKPVRRGPPADTRFFRADGDEIHEVAVGPVHAGVIEPGHFRFQCHGERVLHLEIALGYQHRGVERALAAGPDRRSIHYAETLAGDSTAAHATAYAQIVEALAGATPPPRALALRAVALELERMANHTGDLGALAGDVGYLPTASFCGRLRGEYLNLTALLCGSRLGRGLIRPGGAGFDADPDRLAELAARLDVALRDTAGAVDLLWETPSVMNRFDGVGTVGRADALALGLVGPAARACGLTLDARTDFPTGWYGTARPSPATWEGGDVRARARVRWTEIERSGRFVLDLLRGFPAGAFRSAVGTAAPRALAVALVEGWRGEACHVALTGPDDRFASYNVVDPSCHNWFGLAYAMRGQQISDFPLCNKSFNLSYCGHDL